MIGGVDTRIATRAGKIALEVAVRAVRQCWPQAVFENGETGEQYNTFRDISFGSLNELFVYRNQSLADAWENSGAVPELYNTMIHLIAHESLVTVVMDEDNAVSEQLISAIQSALSDDILFVVTLPEAA